MQCDRSPQHRRETQLRCPPYAVGGAVLVYLKVSREQFPLDSKGGEANSARRCREHRAGAGASVAQSPAGGHTRMTDRADARYQREGLALGSSRTVH